MVGFYYVAPHLRHRAIRRPALNVDGQTVFCRGEGASSYDVQHSNSDKLRLVGRRIVSARLTRNRDGATYGRSYFLRESEIASRDPDHHLLSLGKDSH